MPFTTRAQDTPEFQSLDKNRQQKLLGMIEPGQQFVDPWKAMGTAAKDLAAAPVRLGASVAETGWQVAGAIAGNPKDKQYAQAQVDYLQQLKKDLTYNEGMTSYHDVAVVGMGMGAALGKGVYALQANAAPWVKNLSNIISSQQTTTATAFSAGVGEVAIEAAMSSVVDPLLDMGDYDEDTKMAIRMGMYLVLGFGSAATLEHKIDKLVGNKAFLGWIDKHAKSIPEALRRANIQDEILSREELISKVVQGDERAMIELAETMGESPEVFDNLRRATQSVQQYWDNLATRRGETPEPDLNTMKAFYESPDFVRAVDDYTLGHKAADSMDAAGGPASATIKNDAGRVYVQFPEFPGKDVLEPLKQAGFRWNSSTKTWVAPETAGAQKAADALRQKAPDASPVTLKEKDPWLTKVKETLGIKSFFPKAKPQEKKPGPPIPSKKTPKTVAMDFWMPAGSMRGDLNAKYPQGARTTKTLIEEGDRTGTTRNYPLGKPGERFQLQNGGLYEIVQVRKIPKNAHQDPEFQKSWEQHEGWNWQYAQKYLKAQVHPGAFQTIFKKVADAPRPVDSPVKANEAFKPVVDRAGNAVVKFRDGEGATASETFIRSEDVYKQFPQTARWLQENGKSSIEEGYTSQDLMVSMRRAYNEFKPGHAATDEQIEAHMGMLREFEDMMDGVRRHLPSRKDSQWMIDLETLLQKGLLNKSQHKTILSTVAKFNRDPDFALVSFDRSGYQFLNNTIYLKDPKDFFHETGHWAWYHALSKDDRVNFTQHVLKNYKTQEDWDRLWPTRKGARAEGQDSPGLDWITELYADMSRNYINNWRLTDAESAGIMKKMVKAARNILKAMKVGGYEVPQDLRRYVDKIMKAPEPNPNAITRYKEFDDMIERSWMYRDNATFMRTIENMVGDQPANQSVDLWLQAMLREGDISAFDALLKSGADVENILERQWKDVLTWWHTQEGNPAEINAVFRRMVELFRPDNKHEMLQQITRTSGKPQQMKHDPQYNPAVGDRMSPEESASARRSKGEQTSSDQTLEKIHAEQMYRSLKERLNEMGKMHKWMEISRSVRKPDPIVQSQETYARLQQMWLEEAASRLQGVQTLSDPRYDVTRSSDGEPVGVLRGKSVDESGSAKFDEFEQLSMDESLFTGWDPEHARWMQLRFWPQAVSAMMGIDTSSDTGIPVPGTNTRLTWSPSKWLTYGYGAGPMLSAYSMFGRGVKRETGKQLSKLWDKIETMSPEEAKILEMKWQGVKRSEWIRAFQEREGLTGDLADIHKTKYRDEILLGRRIQQMANKLNEKFTMDEQRAISELIERNGDMDVSGLRQEVYEAAESVKRFTTGVREQLISAGYPREHFEQYGDRYLHRVFQSNAKKWFFQDNETRRANRMYQSMDAGFMSPRGLTSKLRFGSREHQGLMTGDPGLKTGDRVYDFGTGDNRQFVSGNETRRIAEMENEGLSHAHEWKVERIDPKNQQVILRRDYTKFERDSFKEIREIAPRLQEYGKLVSKTLAVSKAFNRIAANPEWAVDPKALQRNLNNPELFMDTVRNLKERGWVEVPDTDIMPGVKRYGALGGKLVDPEAMYTMKSITSTRPTSKAGQAIWKYYRPVLNAWKVAKTAYNPGTHGRNFTANAFMCTFDGRSPTSVVKLGAQHIWKKDDLFNRAIEAGMLDSNVLRGELGLESFMRSVEEGPGARHLMEDADSLLGKYWTGLGRAAKWTAAAPMRIYELGDEVFKMGIFAQEIAKGKTDAEAIAKAQELFFDYRDVPQGTRFIRDWGILPFITYTYKVLPVLAKVANENPHRILAAIGAMELMSNVMMHSDYGEGAKDVKALDQELMPDWMGKPVYGAGPRGVMYTGKDTNKFGVDYHKYIDYTGQLPGGDAFSAHGMFGGFPFGMNPMGTIMFGLLEGRDPNFGKDIMTNPDSLSSVQQRENTVAMLKFIARTLLPNVPVYPGSWSLDSLGNALTAQGTINPETANEMGWTGMDYWGTDESLLTESVKFSGLMRPRKFYTEMETVRRVTGLVHEGKRMEATIRNMAQDHRTSEAEMNRAFAKYMDIVEVNSKAMEFVSEMYTEFEKARAQAPTVRSTAPRGQVRDR